MPKDMGNGWTRYKPGEVIPAEELYDDSPDEDVGEMWRSWNQMKKERRHAALKKFEQENWGQLIREKTGLTFIHHSTYHYSSELLGEQLHYWPSTNKWRWRRKNYNGRPYHLVSFINNRLKVEASKKEGRKNGTDNNEHVSEAGANQQEPQDVPTVE